MNISIVVMAVESRGKWARQLAKRFGCDIVWDTERSVWDTGRRALLAAEGAWHVVLQDDCVPNEHFTRTLLADALRHCDERPLAFYTGDVGRFRHPDVTFGHDLAKANGAGWVEYPGPVWGPAIAVPASHVEAIVAHGDKDAAKGYDTKIMNYYKSIRRKCWYSSPSLVEHRPVSENPSAITKNRTANRQAYELGAPRDWSKVIVADRHTMRPWVWVTDGTRRKKVRRHTSLWQRLVGERGYVEVE